MQYCTLTHGLWVLYMLNNDVDDLLDEKLDNANDNNENDSLLDVLDVDDIDNGINEMNSWMQMTEKRC